MVVWPIFTAPNGLDPSLPRNDVDSRVLIVKLMRSEKFGPNY